MNRYDIMQIMKIAVVIPNFNGAERISAAISSLEHQTQPADIIVVDNGSSDNSVGRIENMHENIHLIKHEKNLGFTGGVNAGIRYALEEKYDEIALFNNDAVAEPQWLEHLTKRLASNPKLGIVASKQLRPDGTIDTTGDEYSVWGTPFPRGEGETDEGQYDENTMQDIPSATAGATLYRARLFEDIGLFDQRFFAYYEDVDISFRARFAGWQIAYEPKAVVHHEVSGTSRTLGNFRDYHMLKNTFYLFMKIMPPSLFIRYLPFFLLTMTYKTISQLLHLRILLILKFWGALLVGLPRLLLDRWRIQDGRKLSSAEVKALLYPKMSPKQRQKFRLSS